MADGRLTLEIDEALATGLRTRAEAAGQSVVEYAYRVLERDSVERPGFKDNEAHWKEVRAIPGRFQTRHRDDPGGGEIPR